MPQLIEARVTLEGSTYRADLAAGIDLALPVDFNGRNPSFYDLPQPRLTAVEGGGFVGDTARGGSCNCSTLELTPHGSMTHTESAAHLDRNEATIAEAAPNQLLVCQLVSVQTELFSDGNESYNGFEAAEDWIVSAAALQANWPTLPGVQSLVIRTLPDKGKARRDYGQQPAPYLSHEAIELIVARGVDHLVLDLPSLDRHEDGGTLPNHRIFWQLPKGGRAAAHQRTLTELALVPQGIPDGLYLLDLQVPRMLCDAAPSRPLLFSLELER